MLSRAKSKFIRFSPYKLRPLADAVRGCSVHEAFACLKTCRIKRANVLLKTLFSAYSNARHKNPEIDSMEKAYVKEIRVDQGPIVKYFKPGAMGRANEQRKRMSHLEIIIDKKIK